MATNVVGDHCAAELVVPEGCRETWVECPHCHGRVVNPAALVGRPLSFPLSLAGVLGALLLMGGCGGAVCGSFPSALYLGTSRPGAFWLAAGACLLAIVAGLVLMVGVQQAATRTAKTAGIVLAVMAVAALFGLAAAVILLVTCFGLS